MNLIFYKILYSKIHLLAVLILCIFFQINSKIRFICFHYNRPDFIEIQYKTINKFLKEKDDAEIIVINDAVDQILKRKIEQICKKFNILCVNYPQHLHSIGHLIENPIFKAHGIDSSNGSIRHCQAAQYALYHFGYDHNDIVVILDGDMFLIREFSIRDALRNYDIVGTLQTDRQNGGFEYIWLALVFFNPNNLTNIKTLSFDLTFHNNYYLLDSGGSSYYYLLNNPQVRSKKYPRIPIVTLPRSDEAALKNYGYTQNEINFLKNMRNYNEEHPWVSVEFHMNNCFLHFSWSRESDQNDMKSIAFKEFFNSIL